MVRIRVSYEEPQELHAVLKLLHPIVKSYKAEKGGDGRYRRAYLDAEIPKENSQGGVNTPLV